MPPPPQLLPLLLLLLTAPPAARANLEVLTNKFTADPAPFAHGGRLYVTTSHDIPGQAGWLMKDYVVMSTDDLANWRDEGIAFSAANSSWATYAWAQQVVERPAGTFTMFWPGMGLKPAGSGSGIGVARASAPAGPYVDLLNAPLAEMRCGDDPTVFVDDDGSVILCANCGGPFCGVLNDDMVSFKQAPALLAPALPWWFEAPWLTKKDGTYFLSYMCNQDSTAFTYGGYSICYGSSNASALGPYEFRGTLMWSPPENCSPAASNCTDWQGGDNNHQGIVEFPVGSGRHLFAYHTRKLARERGEYRGYQRNIALDALYFTANGGAYPLPASLPWLAGDAGAPGIVPVTATPSWLRMAKFLDPYALQRAVTTAYMSVGLDSEPCSEGGLNLGFVTNGSYTTVRGADFGAGAGASSITFRVATPLAGGVISVVLDGGAAITSCSVPNTGDWQSWADVSCGIAPAVTGVHDLAFVFTGPGSSGLFNVASWAFSGGGAASGAAPPPVQVPVAIRAMSSGLLLEASSDPNSDGVLTPSGAGAAPDAAALFTLVDNADGTYSLQAAAGSPAAGKFVCAELSGSGPLCAHSASVADACTRFWLYATLPGTYALLSASNGLFVVSGDAGEPLMASAVDPRGVAADGARFAIEQQPGSVWVA
jgi:arabinoxylan arabinofuranohydrolase